MCHRLGVDTVSVLRVPCRLPCRLPAGCLALVVPREVDDDPLRLRVGAGHRVEDGLGLLVHRDHVKLLGHALEQDVTVLAVGEVVGREVGAAQRARAPPAGRPDKPDSGAADELSNEASDGDIAVACAASHELKLGVPSGSEVALGSAVPRVISPAKSAFNFFKLFLT